MKRWSRGYEALRIYVRFAFWLTHKKIVVTGKEHIPKNRPIIFAANHQNALMDPLALVCTNPLQTLWLARADIFKSKFTQPILKFLKMVPIYRIRDGKDNLTNNEQIFNLVTGVLEDKQSIALFPEAAHSGKRQMLQHKKAIPRIALDAEEKNNFRLGLQIVPVGIYYDHYWNFNRTLIVQYGKAIGIDHYQSEFQRNPQNAMLLLRDEIHDILEPLTLQIDSREHYADCEFIREVVGEELPANSAEGTHPLVQKLRAEQRLMTQLSQLESADSTAFQDLVGKSRELQSQLVKMGISSSQLTSYRKSSWPLLILQLAGAILSLPVLLLGLLFNLIPYLIPRKLLTRKVKDPAFRSTFIFVTGLLLFPIFYLLEMALVGVLTGSGWNALATLIAMPFVGKWSYRLLVFHKNLLKIIGLKFMASGKMEKLWNLRSGLVRMLQKQKA